MSLRANNNKMNSQDWKAVAQKSVADILPATAWVLTLFNIIAAVAHHLVQPIEIAQFMTPLSAFIAVTIICSDIILHQILKKDPDFYDKVSPHLILMFYGLLNLFAAASMFYLRGNALETTNFMILGFGAGSLMIRSRYYIATMILIAGSWLLTANLLTMTPEMIHFGFALLATLILSGLIHVFRRNNLIVLESLRIKEKIHQKELLRSAKMVALGEMASGIAHEINNPLMVIMGKADSLRRTIQSMPDNEKALADIDKIENTVERIAKIIKGLNIFSRRADVDPKQIYGLLEIVDGTLGLCQQKLNIHQVQVSVDIDSKIKVYCRPPQISQVLLNLIGNSIDAIQANEDKWIRLSVRDFGNFVEFRVTDSGSQISADIQQKIMQPFFTTKELGHGTGLGLSISKNIVEDHGGHLYYDNEHPNTCFVMTLPTSEKTLWSQTPLINFN